MSRTKGARSSRLPLLTDEIGPAGKSSAATTTPAAESELTRRILADVIKRVEPTLEEALVPALARVGQALLIQLRAELAASLRDVIARAVAEELSRHRKR